MSIFAELSRGIATHSAAEMEEVGGRLALALPPNAALALHGDLGVGKTTLVRGMARALGIQQPITSPTFTVFNLHRGKGGCMLVHMDAYRLSGAASVEALMLDDFLEPPYLLAVEWPENISDWLPKSAIHLGLAIEPGGVHRVSIT